MTEYKPVTVEAARRISDEFNKHVVVIVSVDHQHQQTHFTSFGRYAEDKILAAYLSEEVAKASRPYPRIGNEL